MQSLMKQMQACETVKKIVYATWTRNKCIKSTYFACFSDIYKMMQETADSLGKFTMKQDTVTCIVWSKATESPFGLLGSKILDRLSTTESRLLSDIWPCLLISRSRIIFCACNFFTSLSAHAFSPCKQDIAL